MAHLRAVVRERQLAGAVERRRDRLGPGGGVAVLVAADPRPEAERRPDAGQPAPQLARQVGRLLEQALLEEPESVADLVDDARSQRAHLVGLPERGHLLGDRIADPVAPGRGEIGVVELVAASRLRRRWAVRIVRRVASVGCAVSTSSSETPAAARARLSSSIPGRGQLGERGVERLARELALVLVLASAAQAVVLLGEVGELEVEPEGAQHVSPAARAAARRTAAARSERGPGRPARLRLARERADPLLVGEELLAFLLDEDAPEDLPEQPDVPAERCLGVAHGVRAG